MRIRFWLRHERREVSELLIEKQRIERELTERLEIFVRAATMLRGALDQVQEELGNVLGTRPTIRAAEVAPSGADTAREDTPSPTRYVVTARFLYDAYSKLMVGRTESMFYVTGVRVGNIRTLDRVIEFALDKQTPTYVSGDEAATRDALIEAAEYGQALHAAFHSHRMVGRESVRPSGTDMKHQERLERGRYPVVSAIFGDDGYVRFFACDRRYTVEVIGKEVERVEEGLFRLTRIAASHLPRGEDNGVRGAISGRSDGAPAGVQR